MMTPPRVPTLSRVPRTPLLAVCLVSSAQPACTGVCFVELDLLDADSRHPEPAELTGAGMFFALGDAKGILAHRETDGSLHVHAALRTAEERLSTVDFTDPGAVRAELLEQFADGVPVLRRLIADSDGQPVPRHIHALPVGHAWPRTTGARLWARRLT